jgi:hypothetical protein
MTHFAIKHPVRLEPVEMGVLSDDVGLQATDSAGNRVTIIASRARWNEALRPRFGPRPSAGEVARGMFLRDEIYVAEFEKVLDRERSIMTDPREPAALTEEGRDDGR